MKGERWVGDLWCTAHISVPVKLGEDVERRRVVSASSTDHLQVHGGRSVNVPSFAPVLSGFQPPQRLLLFGSLRPRRLPRPRVVIIIISPIVIIITISRHRSEQQGESPNIPACERRRRSSSSGGSSALQQKREAPELRQDRSHNKKRHQVFKTSSRRESHVKTPNKCLVIHFYSLFRCVRYLKDAG